MSQNYPVLFGQQYATAVQLLLQQRDSRLGGKVMSGSHSGEQASPVDQIGSIEMQPVTSRFGAIGRVDAPLTRRWVTPKDFDLPQLVDSFDELKTLSDPKSKYVQNAMQAAKREMDRQIISAFFGNALTGKTGSTSTSFAADGGGSVAVTFGGGGSNTGGTVAKLREAKRILMANEVDLESDELFYGTNAAGHDRLLQELQVISSDFNSDAPVLTEGKITRFMGFSFVHSELFGVDGSGYRELPCWAKSGMHLGIWKDMVVDVDKRKDLSGHPWQAYLMLSLGATRIEGKKVVKILADEAA
jgi:hypothetical protein